jgi:hypothetical protein
MNYFLGVGYLSFCPWTSFRNGLSDTTFGNFDFSGELRILTCLWTSSINALIVTTGYGIGISDSLRFPFRKSINLNLRKDRNGEGRVNSEDCYCPAPEELVVADRTHSQSESQSFRKALWSIN